MKCLLKLWIVLLFSGQVIAITNNNKTKSLKSRKRGELKSKRWIKVDWWWKLMVDKCQLMIMILRGWGVQVTNWRDWKIFQYLCSTMRILIFGKISSGSKGRSYWRTRTAKQNMIIWQAFWIKVILSIWWFRQVWCCVWLFRWNHLLKCCYL